MTEPRTARDVLGEALRRNRYGEMRPLWNDMDLDMRSAARMAWLDQADFILARLAKAGFRVVGDGDGAAQERDAWLP